MEPGSFSRTREEMKGLSLMDKYRLLYEKKKNQEYHIPADKFAKYGPPVFIFGVTGVCVYAFFMVLPYHYEKSGGYVLFYHQAFTAVVAVEMIVNWFCIRLVDSSYRPTGDCQNTLNTTTNERNNINYPSTSVRNRNSPLPDSSRGDSTISTNEQGSGAGGAVRYSYWSWKPCMVCNWMRPPRTSHCPFCKKCFLKRDHHCYIAGACLGWRNYRHFLVFSLWTTIAAIYGTCHSLSYFCTQIWPFMSFLDFVFIFSIIRWILRFTTFHIASAMTFATLLLFLLYEIPSFLKDHVIYALHGNTSLEYNSVSRSVKITDNRTFTEKMRSIFGDYWILNIIVPLHFVFPPHEDPINWPHITVNELTNYSTRHGHGISNTKHGGSNIVTTRQPRSSQLHYIKSAPGSPVPLWAKE